jgi:gliding motility-associated-like protein
LKKHNLHIILFVLLLSLPGFISGQDTVVCYGDQAAYSVNSDYPYNSTFLWTVEGGELTDNYGDSIVVNWNEEVDTGKIFLTEVGLGNCEGPERQYVVEISRPVAYLGEDQEICDGESYPFTPGTGYSDYTWPDGSDDDTYYASSTGWVWVEVTNEYGCTDTDSAYLTVHDLPDVDISVSSPWMDNVNVFEDSVAFLGGEVDYITLDAGIWNWYLWNTGDGMPAIDVYAEDIIEGEMSTKSKEYWVTVENEHGCQNTDSITITVVRDLRIPNAITPNGDPYNQKWRIEALSLYPNCKVQIFDRWGNLVYLSKGYDEEDYWDGTDRTGEKLPMASYYYVIDLGNGEKPIYGSVTIIR